jgi:uncharacterized membrane protein
MAKPVYPIMWPDMSPEAFAKANEECERITAGRKLQAELDRQGWWNLLAAIVGGAWVFALACFVFCMYVVIVNAATAFTLGYDESAFYWMRVLVRPTWASFFAVAILWVPAAMLNPGTTR